MSPQTDTHLQVTLKFEPEADGVTFKLSGAFYDTVPAGSPRLPGWTGLPTNSPLGHAASPETISIDRICGPFEKLSADTFAVQIDGDVLKFTPVPPRAKFPVKVTVVAWQYGHSSEPKLKNADPLERSFNLFK
jgi:hypothetical protein